MEKDWSMDLRDAQPWANYILPDGRILHLPADPWNKQKFLKKGWRLQPKTEPNKQGG